MIFGKLYVAEDFGEDNYLNSIQSDKKFTVLNQENNGSLTILNIKVIPNHQWITDDPIMQRFIVAMKKVEREMER